MPKINGRDIPDFYKSAPRNTNTAKVRLVVNPRPDDSDPNRYTYREADIAIGQSMKTRRMILKSNPQVYYEFTFPPTQIAYEGFGAEITEIPRPLQRPLIDVRGAKNYKAVFEFLVAGQYDGIATSVEDQLAILQLMVNYGEPVYFENFDFFITKGFWFIAEFSVKSSRVNTDGEIVAAQCSIGLLEYQETNTLFAKFPKINYKKTTTRRTGGGNNNDNDPVPPSEGQGTSVSGVDVNGALLTTFPGLSVTPTQVFRWFRNTAPTAFEKKYAPWQKVGNKWVLYTKTFRLPYSLYDLGINEDIQAKAVKYKNLTQAAKQTYIKQQEFLKTAPVYGR